eukprot:CAMPEP_0174386950 /NCGR_PEP_ID=MMETSP0811_2-20130205/127633_1 /TAXON_ID=73025 ORGANISM="Eutreptiella gymnastica-like, Strain CCMP1594" /NCGR_SAMPLE_ID=MMETSP0811_2 /ASSEMBLY_ACC=CAM_ASM_000667 /LENGTH=112 /DNA_ID=CAMNT_0015541821 /DNA_START=682 /DNA_END=1020 /DNA_ORIENTATION=+
MAVHSALIGALHTDYGARNGSQHPAHPSAWGADQTKIAKLIALSFQLVDCKCPRHMSAAISTPTASPHQGESMIADSLITTEVMVGAVEDTKQAWSFLTKTLVNPGSEYIFR